VKANREYELLVRRASRWPALLAAPDVTDQVEVVEVATGEVVLLWDVPARDTGRLTRALRADLVQLDPAAFLARWGAQDRPRHPARTSFPYSR
jgi:hypothetical protein